MCGGAYTLSKGSFRQNMSFSALRLIRWGTYRLRNRVFHRLIIFIVLQIITVHLTRLVSNAINAMLAVSPVLAKLTTVRLVGVKTFL